MLKYISSIINPKITIYHNKISIIPTYTYDSWNKIENGQVKFDVYDDTTHLGFVDFRISTGQIGLIDIKEQYRNQGIAKFLLTYVEKELRNHHINKIFTICTFNHYFWSKQQGYIYDNRPHTSVTSSGYVKRLD